MLAGAHLPAAGRFPAGSPPAPAPNEAAFSARAQSSGGAGGTGVAAMLVTSWAFTVLRRCNRADGRRSGGNPCRSCATSKMSRPARFDRSSASRCGQGVQGLPAIMDEAPDQRLFRRVSAARRTAAPAAVSSVFLLDGGLTNFCPDDVFCHPALWAIRSANWSRAAASGIWAATVSILPRNCRRLSSLAEVEPGGGLIQQVL